MEEILRTIKREKFVRLDELIKYVLDNRESLFKDCKERTFKTADNKTVTFTDNGLYDSTGEGVFDPKDLFLVEMEEEITLYTEFDILITNLPREDEEPLVDVYLNHSINDVIEADKVQGVETDKIYVLKNNEFSLVWERED